MSFLDRADYDDRAPEQAAPKEGGSVLVGEDWVNAEPEAELGGKAKRGRRSLLSLNRSPLARKIIIFNLMALVIMVAGVMFVNPFRDSLVQQREVAMTTEARLLAVALEARLPKGGAEKPLDSTLSKAALEIAAREISTGTELFIYDSQRNMLASTRARGWRSDQALVRSDRSTTYLTDTLNAIWNGVTWLVPGGDGAASPPLNGRSLGETLVARAEAGETVVRSAQDRAGATIFAVATPVMRGAQVEGVVVISSAAGALDALVRHEREQVLRMFAVALVVAIVLSMVLASTIANPLSDLAAAAEIGRDRNARKMAPGRVRIPDLTERPDEIGRLSGALRGMVTALYDRIEANEQFAADVSHEIKNPLASLRSAVGSLRLVKRDDHRERLLDVIEHDVRRLDRLVSDISNASRLDSELVKEEEEEFDLVRTLANINEYLGEQARAKGVEYITDLPGEPILIHGLEARLAQVFVNIIGNAISFCENGDAVRVWVRRREHRALVVVEDTGPGIPEQALQKIFKRFYSERPVVQFGEHSGLGLAISKQIVEAHGGVIWAENIHPTEEDATSEPLGARFVVGLPV